MEIVAILRTLWRRRLLVIAGLVAAAAAAVLMGNAVRTTSAVGWTRILSDTSKSQLIYPEPLGGETTGWRGQLAIDLMLTPEATQRIAREAGIPHDQLLVVDPVLTAPSVPASLPRRAAKSANGATAGAPYQLALSLDTVFPIIHVESAAPDRDHAARLVDVATSIIRSTSSRVENKELQGITFEPVESTRTRVINAGGGRGMAVAVGLVLFLLWSGSVAFVSLVLDQRRRLALRKISPLADVDFA